MKISARQIDAFVKNPDKSVRVILVYGPDSGLMKERIKALGKSVVEDLNDPFNVAVLDNDQLVQDPARLSDEASAMSMMGGDRLIRIEDAGDKITALLKEYLENPNDNALVLLEGSDLGPRSSLRKLCESANNAAALPCYVEDERDLARFIRETLQAQNLTIEPDAVTWLSANIAGDRGRARSEIEKLCIYKGSEASPITMADATAACGSAGAQTLDDLVNGVANRQTDKAMKVYQQLLQEGVNFVPIIRSLQNHFRRLHLAKSIIEAGGNAESAMKSLRPPVFFKQADAFRGQLQSWSLSAVSTVLDRLSELEAQCKQTGAPTETLCAQAVLGISASRKSR